LQQDAEIVQKLFAGEKRVGVGIRMELGDVVEDAVVGIQLLRKKLRYQRGAGAFATWWE